MSNSNEFGPYRLITDRLTLIENLVLHGSVAGTHFSDYDDTLMELSQCILSLLAYIPDSSFRYASALANVPLNNGQEWKDNYSITFKQVLFKSPSLP